MLFTVSRAKTIAVDICAHKLFPNIIISASKLFDSIVCVIYNKLVASVSQICETDCFYMNTSVCFVLKFIFYFRMFASLILLLRMFLFFL